MKEVVKKSYNHKHCVPSKNLRVQIQEIRKLLGYVKLSTN